MGNCPGGPCSNLAEGGGRVHQTYSDDFGRTWSEPEDIADGLGDHPGLLPGPGSGGTQIPSGGVHGGRLVFVGLLGFLEEERKLAVAVVLWRIGRDVFGA